MELRTRILETSLSGQWKEREVADLFSVSLTTVQRLRSKHRHGQSLEPSSPTGAPRKLNASHLQWLKRYLNQWPYATSYELTQKFNRAHRQCAVHRSTILRAMHELGYSYKKNTGSAATRPA